MRSRNKQRTSGISSPQDQTQRDDKNQFIATLKRRLRLPDVFSPYDRVRDPIPDDLRVYKPATDRLPRLSDGRRVSFTLDKRVKVKRGPLTNIRFTNPDLTPICHRRKKRRESLFALRKAGKGRSIRTPKKRNAYSDVRC